MNGGWLLSYKYVSRHRMVFPQIKYSGLVNLYNYKNISYQYSYNILGQPINVWRNMGSSEKHRLLRNAYWENLGRILHLLQDMTLSCHAHNDAHPNLKGTLFAFQDEADAFHVRIDGGKYLNYTAVDALKDGGIIKDISNKKDPLRYLFYTANQIADFYPSYEDDGTKEVSGNKTWDRAKNGDTFKELNYFYDKIVGNRSVINSFSDFENKYPEMEKYLYTMSIRLTASFLYWMAQEIGDLPKTVPPPPPLLPLTGGLSLSGNPTVTYRKSKIITANARNGSGNYSYYWWFSYGVRAFSPGDTNFRPIENKNYKYISWTKTSDNTKHMTLYGNSYSKHGFYDVKCIIRDKKTNESITAYYTVKVKFKDTDRSYYDLLNANGITDLNFSASNYPNPFNPVTNIIFTLPKSSYVEINVYNSVGQKVKTLLKGYKFNGKHTVKFDGNGLASGVYIYRIKAGENYISKRITLLK